MISVITPCPCGEVVRQSTFYHHGAGMAIELDVNGARRLVFAVTLKALGDARRGDRLAADWLIGNAPDWLEAAGMREITPGDVRAAIEDRTPLDVRGW